MSKLSFSIITVSYNSETTISDTINSVLNQTYPGIEYVIIDGASTDGTKKILDSFKNRITKLVSEHDRGLYDAINKGIKLATGDIVGILHSDDFFYNNTVVEKIARAFEENETDAVIGDIQFVDPVDTSKIVRYFSSKKFSLTKFRFGYMPPHPSFYVRRELFEKLGYYKTDYKIAADYELVLRFLLISKIKYKYLEMPFVSMRSGGVSNKSIGSNIILNKEIARACRENGIYTNYLLIYLKYITKVFEFFGKKVKS
jgi:glycosyltransferase involved in cell wall biosynthesis